MEKETSKKMEDKMEGLVNLAYDGPVRDFIFVVPSTIPEKSEGGIVLPDNRQREEINFGRIWKLGPDCSDSYRTGDYVEWSIMAGEKMSLPLTKDKSGKDVYFICIREEDVKAKLKTG